MDARYRFALASIDLLNGPRHLSALPGQANRIDCARAVGYRSGESVDVARMFKDLIVMFGTGYFNEIGIPLHTDAWLRRAFFGAANSIHCPARTMLLDFLLRDRVDRMAKTGVPVCPGSSSPQDQEHRILVKGSEEGRHHYFCSCGFSFLCGSKSAAGAIELIPTQEGHDISLAAVILGNRGRSQHWIAGILGLDADYTSRLLAQSSEVRPWRRRTERARHLAAWIELVDRCVDADAALTKDHRLWLSLGRLARSLPESIVPTNGLEMIRTHAVRDAS